MIQRVIYRDVDTNVINSEINPVCAMAGLAAYTVVSGQKAAQAGLQLPILFASPHSGGLYPEAMLETIRVPLIDLRRTEDAFVEELFADAPKSGGQLIYANYARGYVDLNRDARELDPAMFHDGPPRKVVVASPRVEAGLGCLPRVAARGEPIYDGQISRAEGEYRLAQVHDAYHGYIRGALDRFKEVHGVAVLIDCHSMPSRQPGRRKLADIVLGDRYGSSCDSRLTSVAERTFRDLGYTVSRNAPYAGGYTTRCYGRPKRGVHALQIEINRSLYMDEQKVVRHDNFNALKQDIMAVSRGLSDFTRRIMA